jgi:ATP-dependent DNA ligase
MPVAFADVCDYYPGALEFPCWAEPKANGFRVKAVYGARGPSAWSFFSRSGVELQFPEISAELNTCRLAPLSEIDGELMAVAFSVAAAGQGLAGARFLAFDIPTEWGGLDRRQAAMEAVFPEGERIKLLSRIGRVVFNEDDAQAAYETFLCMGFEGAVFKALQGAYGEGWFRRKPKITIDAPICGLAMSKTGIQAILVMVDGVVTRLGMGLSKALKAELAATGAGVLQGRMVEFEAAERLPSGKFQSPVFVRFRDDKQPFDSAQGLGREPVERPAEGCGLKAVGTEG